MTASITNYDVTSLHVVHGTYTMSGGTVTIATGLQKIVSFFLQSTSDATAPYASVSGGTLTATGATAQTGYFTAFGY